MLHTRNWTVTFDQVSKSPSHLAIILDDAHIYTPASNCLRVWILIFGVSVLVNTHSPRPLTDHLYEALSLSLSLFLFLSILSISFHFSLFLSSFLSLTPLVVSLHFFSISFSLTHAFFIYHFLLSFLLSLSPLSLLLYISLYPEFTIYAPNLCPRVVLDIGQGENQRVVIHGELMSIIWSRFYYLYPITQQREERPVDTASLVPILAPPSASFGTSGGARNDAEKGRKRQCK